MQERNGGELSILEPQRLGRGGKLFVAMLGVATLALCVGSVCAWRVKARIERERALMRMKTFIRLGHAERAIVTGQRPLGGEVMSREESARFVRSTIRDLAESRVLDGWGNRFIYRCPGPVHTKGWDLYSMGPNGTDDFGLGDDILVGEDVAPETSAH